MIRYEWKKLLFGRKGWLLILAFLIAELAGTLLFTQPYDAVLENHRVVYETYLAQVRGPLTEEKREYLESEMERLNTMHQDLEQLKRDYYSGEVTEEEYRKIFDHLAAEDAKYTGFSKLYSQYIFVRESQERSFLYTGGWEVLLTDQEPDYLFLLALIILLTPIFCEEYACRMHEILLTQKKSARYQVLAKVTVSLLLAATLTAMIQLFDLAYCTIHFGLPNGDYSLQSIQSFGGTAKKLTLWQAFWLQFALKELGYLYVAVLILFLSVCLKKFALSLMAGIAFMPIPLLTVTDHNAFLKIPGPWAFAIGSIYLNGGATELNWTELGLLLLVMFAIIGITLYSIHHRNTNWHLKKEMPCKAVLMLWGVVLLLTGCSQSKETFIYNRSTSSWYEADDYVIIGDYDGSTLIDKVTETTHDFPLSALEGETIACGSTFYGVGNAVYYLKTTTHQPSASWDTISTYCDLVKFDLNTMEESVVYQWNEESAWFFGLLDWDNSVPNSFSVELLFIHENDLYYMDTSTFSLNKMDLLTGQYKVVLTSLNSQDIAYDGVNLYYLDSYNRLVIRTIETSKEQAIDEVVASKFLLTSDGIYFLNRRDNSTLYFWDKSIGAVSKISDLETVTIYWSSEYLWTVDGTGMIYRMSHNGKKQAKVDFLERIRCVCNNGNVYFGNLNSEQYYVLEKGSLVPMQID